jgi:hypothetical protein
LEGLAVDIPATSDNIPGTLVLRDASGNLSAGAVTADVTGDITGDVTGNVTGNSSTATALQTSRTIELTGDVTGSASFDGTANASITASIGSGVIVDADVKSDAAIAGTKVAPNFGSQNIQTTGNLAFGGTSNRITGDFSNATISSRAIVQSSTTNGFTNVFVIPNGTATNTALVCASSSSPDNCSLIGMIMDGVGSKAIINSGKAGTGTFVPLVFHTSDTERMRIDASGNVGIGTTSPTFKLVAAGGSQDGAWLGAASTVSFLGLGDYSSGATAGFQIRYDRSGGDTSFSTGNRDTPTERMRITAGGEVYIAGTTDRGAFNLQCNGTGVWGAGAYVNGSDERLKDNIAEITEGLEVVNKLRPVSFNYKPTHSKDTSKQAGFIAQELLVALAGKDYLEGTVSQGPEFYNVAYQNLIPVMAKAIQELSAKVEALEAAR